MEKNMCTHDMIVNQMVFSEWFNVKPGVYYVELCPDCYEKLGIVKEQKPLVEKSFFLPCSACDNNAEVMIEFAENEVEFREKPADWMQNL